MSIRWTKELDESITKLITENKEKKLFYREMAEKLNLNAISIRNRALKLGLKNQASKSRIGEWNKKHSHLHKDILEYFLNHSAKETMEKLGLTKGEFKSCLTYAYKKEDLKHLRKDKRNHKPFQLEDWIFTIKRCGLISRGRIAVLCGRTKSDNGIAIKERLGNLGSGTKSINGLNLTYANILFPKNSIINKVIQTKAGPSGQNGIFYFKILPWITADKLADVYIKDENIKLCIKIMAKFQRFIYNKKDDDEIINEMKDIIKEG